MKIYDFSNRGGISDVFAMTSNFGVYDGYECKTELKENGFVANWGSFCVNGTVSCVEEVFSRYDTVENCSDQEMVISDYQYRFCLPGEEYEIYTQQNNWQNESDGAWQPLVTSVRTGCSEIRDNESATPFLAIWNKQTNKGIAFHVLPKYGWHMTVSKRSSAKYLYTVIEIGTNGHGLNWKLQPGEKKDLCEIWYYEFENKLNFDSHKLHRRFCKEYPRRTMPVLYNTWFTFFDRVNFDGIRAQIKEAAELGCEYFLLDAGWFGHGAWYDYIGDWEENLEGGYQGHMKDVSDWIHEAGMKFGLWLEPERALKNVPIVAEHPEYFFDNGHACFLDFADEKARKYITDLTLRLIETYQIDMIKFDFNESISYDKTGQAFYDYHQGHLQYIKALKEAYPDIYLENCASGGYRMNLEQMKYFDSFWFTDNQSLYDGLRIYKDTLHRLPSCGIEKWAALVSCDGFVAEYGTEDKTVRTLTTNNATWTSVISVTPEYLKGFMTGGIPGLTCDLTKIDPSYKAQLKELISDYKKEREFWKNAAARVISDTEQLLVIQYEAEEQVKLVVYTYLVKQLELTVYPVLENGKYEVNGKEYNPSEGLVISDPKDFSSYFLNLKKKH